MGNSSKKKKNAIGIVNQSSDSNDLKGLLRHQSNLAMIDSNNQD